MLVLINHFVHLTQDIDDRSYNKTTLNKSQNEETKNLLLFSREESSEHTSKSQNHRFVLVSIKKHRC